MKSYSTGEVAKKLNISVRTIRYYDEIGLLKPTSINESGKRLYSDNEVLILEKITLLKSASLSLKDIQLIIDQISINQILKLHQERLKTEMQQLQESLDQTNSLLNVVKLEGTLKWEELLPLFQKAKKFNKEEVWQEMFTEEERITLLEGLPKLEDDPGDVGKWINIIKRIELCIAEGKLPNSPEGRLIAEDVEYLSKSTFGNDEELANKFWELRKSESASQALGLYHINENVIIFLEDSLKGKD